MSAITPGFFYPFRSLWQPLPKLIRRVTRVQPLRRHSTRRCPLYRPGDLLMAAGDQVLNNDGDVALDSSGDVALECTCCGCVDCLDSTPEIITVSISGVSLCPCIISGFTSILPTGDINFSIDLARNLVNSRSCVWVSTDPNSNPTNPSTPSTIPTSQVAVREYASTDCTGSYEELPVFIRLGKVVRGGGVRVWFAQVYTNGFSASSASTEFFFGDSPGSDLCLGTFSINNAQITCPATYFSFSSNVIVATGGTLDITA